MKASQEYWESDYQQDLEFFLKLPSLREDLSNYFRLFSHEFVCKIRKKADKELFTLFSARIESPTGELWACFHSKCLFLKKRSFRCEMTEASTILMNHCWKALQGQLEQSPCGKHVIYDQEGALLANNEHSLLLKISQETVNAESQGLQAKRVGLEIKPELHESLAALESSLATLSLSQVPVFYLFVDLRRESPFLYHICQINTSNNKRLRNPLPGEIEVNQSYFYDFGFDTQDDLLGKGGFGFVVRAEKKTLPKEREQCALKLVPLLSRESYQAAVAEATILQQIQHPNLVEGYDDKIGYFYFSDPRLGFGQGHLLCFGIFMQYISGINLAKLIQRFRSERSPKTTGITPQLYSSLGITILKDIALALQELEKQHNCHRDIKPQNIMIQNLDKAILIDLGLARQADYTIGSLLGDGVGSLSYFPLEVFIGSNQQRRTLALDTYCLGVVFYEMLHGQLPPLHQEVNGYVRLDEVLREKWGQKWPLVEIDPNKREQYHLWREQLLGNNLFEEFVERYYALLEWQESQLAPEIITLLKGLLHPFYEERWSIEKLLKFLDTLPEQLRPQR